MVLFVVAWMHLKCYFLISGYHKFKNKRIYTFYGQFENTCTWKYNESERSSHQGHSTRTTDRPEKIVGTVHVCAGCMCFNHVKFYFQQILLEGFNTGFVFPALSGCLRDNFVQANPVARSFAP